jgi:hypothetical protein
MTEVLRPLTLGELLDRTISLYRRHAVVFSGLIAIPALLGVSARIVQATYLSRNPDIDLTRVLIMVVGFFVFLIVMMISTSISQAATMVAVSQVHLGRPVSIAESFAALRGRLLRLCVITVSLGVILLSTALLLILPIFYFALRWSLAVPAAVLENCGLGQSMDRSATLVEGQYGRIFMIYLLYFVLLMILSSAVQTPMVIILLMRGGDVTAMPLWMTLVTEISSFFVQCLVGPLLTIAIALAYYDARVRKEAFDLQHMLAQLEPGETRQPVLTS